MRPKLIATAAAVAVLAATLAASSASAAPTTDYSLKTPHQNQTVTGGDWPNNVVGVGECADSPPLEQGEVLWHFVLSGLTSIGFADLHGAFGQDPIAANKINPGGNQADWNVITAPNANTGTTIFARTDGTGGVTSGTEASLKVSHTCEPPPTPPNGGNGAGVAGAGAEAVAAQPTFTG